MSQTGNIEERGLVTLNTAQAVRGTKIFANDFGGLPRAVQTLAATSSIVLAGYIIQVQGTGGATTLTSTPTIADGFDGQLVILRGISNTDTVTLQDNTLAAGSNLDLGGVNIVLGAGDSINLCFNAGTGLWEKLAETPLPSSTTAGRLLLSGASATPTWLAAANNAVATTSATGAAQLTSTWTSYAPTVTLVGGGGNTVPVYAVNSGRYLRLGPICFVSIRLSGDGGAEGAGTGQINIALPITASVNTEAYYPNGSMQNGAAEYTVIGYVGASASTVAVYYADTATNQTSATGAQQNNTTRYIYLDFFYEV